MEEKFGDEGEWWQAVSEQAWSEDGKCRSLRARQLQTGGDKMKQQVHTGGRTAISNGLARWSEKRPGHLGRRASKQARVSGTVNKNNVCREHTWLLGEEEEKEQKKQVVNGAGQNKQWITVARHGGIQSIRKREGRGKQRGEWQRAGQSYGTIGQGDNGTGEQHMKQ